MTRSIFIMFLVLFVIAAGLGFYAFYLHHRVTTEERRLAQQPALIPPTAGGPTTPVTLYLASDSDGGLRRVQENIGLPDQKTERDRTILRTLLAQYQVDGAPHALGAGSDIREVFLLNGDTAIVDATAGLADSHPAGVMAEELTIASIVSTLTANDPQVRRVKILIEGKERETLAGHADLARFYSSAEMEALVKDAK
jgi:hypothetical protein